MKTKFKHDELADLGFKEYRNLLYKELARLKKDSPDGATPVEFLVIGQFKYTDTGDKKLPLIIVGERDSNFAKYVKDTVLKRVERDFAIGTCGFGKDGQFSVVLKKGKMPSTIINIANKLLFEPAKLSLSVVESLEADSDGEDTGGEEAAKAEAAKLAAVAAAAAASQNKKGTKEEKIAAAKEKATEELTALSEVLKTFKANFAAVQKTIAPKLKAGEAINRKDMVSIKKASADCDNFDAAFKKASKAAQKEAAKGQAEVAKARVELQKFAVAAQAKKETLAQTLADKFFMKNAKRAAKETEVAMMQSALAAAIADSGVNALKEAERAAMLKAIYLTASLLGPKFGYAQVKVIASRLAA
jgi:hypothetical protein